MGQTLEPGTSCDIKKRKREPRIHESFELISRSQGFSLENMFEKQKMEQEVAEALMTLHERTSGRCHWNFSRDGDYKWVIPICHFSKGKKKREIYQVGEVQRHRI